MCGLSVGFILYYTGKGVSDIKWLLITMSLILFFIAAGQCELGAGWLLRAGVFGTYYTGPLVAPSEGGAQFGDGDETYSASAVSDGYRSVDIRPWWMIPLWDVSGCCGDTDQQNRFFSLMKAIFGYNAMPCYVEVVAYCSYWVLVILYACFKFHRRTLFDADYKHNRAIREKAEQEERAAIAQKEAADHQKAV
jgi:high-affinity iron transporter